MKRNRSNRRSRAGILAFILAIAILVTGTLAWQAISQRAVNNVAGEILPAGARLHDDFGLADEPDFTKPLNKDVYVENYSGQNPQNTSDEGETVFVRVKLMEYMEMGVGAGLFTVSGDDPGDYQTLDQVNADGIRIEDSANEAESLVADASILNLSTWRTHIEGDTTNPFASYWNWKMGGTKAFMPTFNKDNTSLLTDRTEYAQNAFVVGDTQNGTVLYSNPDYNNNSEEHTAKDTLVTAGVISMAEWMDDLNHPMAEPGTGKGYWVGDTDGWYYWSKGLEPGEATALLLDQITLSGTIEGEFYYGIHVISEMATAGDWGNATGQTGFYEDSLTEDGKFLLDQAAAGSTKKKLLYAPMDGIGYPNEDTPLPTAPIIDSVNDRTFSVLAGQITQTTDQMIAGNQSAYFSGAAGQRLNANIPELNLGIHDFTVSFWVNPEAQTVGWPIMFGNDDNANFRFGLADANPWGNGYPCLYLDGGASRLIATKKYTPNVWAHYAVVRENGVLTIYENGINIGTDSDHTTMSVDFTNLSIGGNQSISNTAYKGYMDDVAIYDYAKWSGDFTPPTDAQTDANLVYLDFEESLPSPPINQEPIKEVISSSNFDILGNAFLEGRDDQYKFGGSSLYFPGTESQRINKSIPDLNLSTHDFTVSFWVNPEVQTVGYPAMFGHDNNADLRFFLASEASEVDGYPCIYFGGGSANRLIANKKYTPNVWTHYALVRENGIFTLYENGINIGTNSANTTQSVDFSNLSIGGNQSTSNSAYKGYMDDFTIYNYAVWDSDFTPPTAAGTP